MGQYIRLNGKTAICDVCYNKERNDCRKDPITGLIHCRDFTANPLNYIFLNKTDKIGFGLWRHKDDVDKYRKQKAEERYWQWQLQKAKIELEKEKQLKFSLSIEQRDRIIREIIEQLDLSADDRAKLKRDRHLDDSDIDKKGYRSLEQWQKLLKAVDDRLAGVKKGGRSLLNFSKGILCPIQNAKGQYVGFQFWAENPQKKDRKYTWPAGEIRRKDRPNSNLPNGELPLSVNIPEQYSDLYLERGAIGFCDSVAFKGHTAANFLGIPIVGASGGQFEASSETLKEELQTLKAKEIILYADAGDINNPSMMIAYNKAIDLVRKWKYPITIAWWGQYEKSDGDIDEIDRDRINQITYLTPLEFNRLALPELVREIGDRIPLTKRGKSYSGICPFHSQNKSKKTESLIVEEKRYFCTHCGASGDLSKFLSDWDKLSEILKYSSQFVHHAPTDDSIYLIDDVFKAEEIAKKHNINVFAVKNGILNSGQFLELAEIFNRIIFEEKGKQNIRNIYICPAPGDANNLTKLEKYLDNFDVLEKNFSNTKIKIVWWGQWHKKTEDLGSISGIDWLLKRRFLNPRRWLQGNIHYLKNYSQWIKLSENLDGVNTQIIDQPQLKNLSFMPGFNFLRSELSTGKTETTIDLLLKLMELEPGMIFHWIGHTNNLLLNTLTRLQDKGLNFQHFQSIDRNPQRDKDGRLIEHLLYCLHSCYHFKPSDYDNSAIVIDEIISWLKALEGDSNIKHYSQTMAILKEAFSRAKYLILADGNLVDYALKFCQEICTEKEINLIYNQYELPERQALIYDRQDYFITEILNDNIPFICTTSQNWGDRLEKQILEQNPDANIIRVDGTNSETPAAQQFIKGPLQYVHAFQITHVIISPTLNSGFNGNIFDYFSNVYLYYDGQNHRIDDALQFLMRLRDLNPVRHIYCPEFVPISQDNEAGTINVNKIKADLFDKILAMLDQTNLEIADRDLLVETLLALRKNSCDPLINLSGQLRAIERSEKSYLKLFLERRLLNSGYKVDRYIPNLEITTEQLEENAAENKRIKDDLDLRLSKAMVEAEAKGLTAGEDAPNIPENYPIKRLEGLRAALPNIVISPVWSGEFVLNHWLVDRKITQRLRNRWKLNNFATISQLETYKQKKRTEKIRDRAYIPFHKDRHSNFNLISAFHELDLLGAIALLQTKEFWATDDPFFKEFVARCLANKRRFNLKLSNVNDPFRCFNKILEIFGYKMQSKKVTVKDASNPSDTGKKSDRKWRYRLRDMYDQPTAATLSDRYDDDKKPATSQLKADSQNSQVNQKNPQPSQLNIKEVADSITRAIALYYQRELTNCGLSFEPIEIWDSAGKIFVEHLGGKVYRQVGDSSQYDRDRTENLQKLMYNMTKLDWDEAQVIKYVNQEYPCAKIDSLDRLKITQLSKISSKLYKLRDPSSQTTATKQDRSPFQVVKDYVSSLVRSAVRIDKNDQQPINLYIDPTSDGRPDLEVATKKSDQQPINLYIDPTSDGRPDLEVATKKSDQQPIDTYIDPTSDGRQEIEQHAQEIGQQPTDIYIDQMVDGHQEIEIPIATENITQLMSWLQELEFEPPVFSNYEQVSDLMGEIQSVADLIEDELLTVCPDYYARCCDAMERLFILLPVRPEPDLIPEFIEVEIPSDEDIQVGDRVFDRISKTFGTISKLISSLGKVSILFEGHERPMVIDDLHLSKMRSVSVPSSELLTTANAIQELKDNPNAISRIKNLPTDLFHAASYYLDRQLGDNFIPQLKHLIKAIPQGSASRCDYQSYLKFF